MVYSKVSYLVLQHMNRIVVKVELSTFVNPIRLNIASITWKVFCPGGCLQHSPSNNVSASGGNLQTPLPIVSSQNYIPQEK